MQIDWLEILNDEVSKAGSISAVARQLGYSRTAISRILVGKYDGGTGNIQAKVFATYCDRIVCPHTKTSIAQSECEDFRTRAMPQSDPRKLAHWGTCQTCLFNPKCKKVKELNYA